VAVSLYAFPQATYKGEVFEILPDADREKKAFVTKVRLLDPPEGLRSGMTAEVNVIIEERSGAMLVPADSVSADGSVHVVAGGRVERRMPSLGVHDMLRVEVLGGLMEGDAVVVAGADGLADGTRVVTVEAPPPAAAHDTSAPRGGMSL
jgi:multidrug efflux pump subunit AcrA (membrane-fusion protein)